MNIEQVIEEFGGLSGSINFFGWQGGTIHQVKEEWTKRLHSAGHVIRKDGEICDLAIKKTPVHGEHGPVKWDKSI